MSSETNYLYRVAVVNLLDADFYEPGNASCCHSRCHGLFTRRICGIGEESHWNYLNYPPELLTGYFPPPYIALPLRRMVRMCKVMPLCEAERFWRVLDRDIDIAIRHARLMNEPVCAERVLKYLKSIREIRCTNGGNGRRKHGGRNLVAPDILCGTASGRERLRACGQTRWLFFLRHAFGKSRPNYGSPFRVAEVRQHGKGGCETADAYLIFTANSFDGLK